jgi:ADP-ribose pyrophosphatase
MSQYPNYRISVEAIILHHNKILLTKRADHCSVGPGMWNVPAGKAKYEEIPIEAIVREAKEETSLEVELIKELNVRAFKGRTATEDFYRVMFTYLVKPKHGDISSFRLNDEHSEYSWVDKHEINDPRYDSLHPNLKQIITGVLNSL